MKKYLLILLFTSAAFGMAQRMSFQKLRFHARNYTPAQIENATKDQIQSALNLTDQEVGEYRHFWPGMKEILLRDAIERQTQERLVLLRTRIKAVYPDAIGLQTEYASEIARKLLPLLYGEVDPNAIP